MASLLIEFKAMLKREQITHLVAREMFAFGVRMPTTRQRCIEMAISSIKEHGVWASIPEFYDKKDEQRYIRVKDRIDTLFPEIED